MHINYLGLLDSYYNAMHLGNQSKLDHFRYLLSISYVLSIICLSETKRSWKISDKEFNITNYYIFIKTIHNEAVV